MERIRSNFHKSIWIENVSKYVHILSNERRFHDVTFLIIKILSKYRTILTYVLHTINYISSYFITSFRWSPAVNPIQTGLSSLFSVPLFAVVMITNDAYDDDDVKMMMIVIFVCASFSPFELRFLSLRIICWMKKKRWMRGGEGRFIVSSGKNTKGKISSAEEKQAGWWGRWGGWLQCVLSSLSCSGQGTRRQRRVGRRQGGLADDSVKCTTAGQWSGRCLNIAQTLHCSL